MKVNRIDVMIKRDLNKHVPNIDMPIMDLQRYYKFGGLSTNDRIELHSMPETVLEKLKELKIKFERIIKNDKQKKQIESVVIMIKIKNTLIQTDLVYINSYVVDNKVYLLLYDEHDGKLVEMPYNNYVQRNYRVKVKESI